MVKLESRWRWEDSDVVCFVSFRYENMFCHQVDINLFDWNFSRINLQFYYIVGFQLLNFLLLTKQARYVLFIYLLYKDSDLYDLVECKQDLTVSFQRFVQS